jgi:hypothetical protein
MHDTWNESALNQILETAGFPHIEPFILPRERLRVKLIEGVPLLHGEPVLLDVPFTVGLLGRLVASSAQGVSRASRADRHALREALDLNRLPLDRLVEELFVHHQDHIVEIAHAAGVSAPLLCEIGEQAVRPLRQAYTQALVKRLDRDASGLWQRAYCPVCGSTQRRHDHRHGATLHCGACGAWWHYQETAPTDAPSSAPSGLADYHPPPGPGFRIELALPADEWTEDLDG